MAARRFDSLQLSLLFLFAMILSCGVVKPTPISKILANPRAYEGDPLVLEGTVTDRVSIYVFKFFILKDETGEIPVVTDRILPNIGTSQRIQGMVREAFAIGDKQMVVVVEKSGGS